MRYWKFILLTTIVLPVISQAQIVDLPGKHTSYWALRGGYLRTYPLISEPTIPSPNLYTTLGIGPINSYYLGIAYAKTWNKIGYVIEGTIQRRGMTGVDLSQFSKFSPTNSYYYLNLAPSVRYNLVEKLAIQLGPEVNVLLAKQSAFANSRLVEIGAFTRLNYTISDLTLQLGASHGFTPYSTSKLVNKDVFNLRSTTLQVGISYRLDHLRL
ncbi:hypothetical protein [Spirosoma aerophilum]